MPDKPRLAGHRVLDISFRKGWVECDCGERFKVKIDPDLPKGDGHDALAAVFSAHRKAETAKAQA
jgi:hypothetical protein